MVPHHATLHSPLNGMYKLKYLHRSPSSLQAPEQPDLTIDTAQQSLEQSVEQLIALLTDKGVLS